MRPIRKTASAHVFTVGSEVLAPPCFELIGKDATPDATDATGDLGSPRGMLAM